MDVFCYRTPAPLLLDPSTFAIGPQHLWCRTPAPLVSGVPTKTRLESNCIRGLPILFVLQVQGHPGEGGQPITP